jgi:protein arginine N-methyltransferase 3
MNHVYFDEGLVEVVDVKEMVTSECVVRVSCLTGPTANYLQDINTHTATPKSLDFTSPFTLSSTSQRPATIRAFLTHFDTFFSADPTSQTGPDDKVDLTAHDFDEYARPVKPFERPISFTTGPRGRETHWRQVVFLLRDEILLHPGKSSYPVCTIC